jgi:hypothetical protein
MPAPETGVNVITNPLENCKQPKGKLQEQPFTEKEVTNGK